MGSFDKIFGKSIIIDRLNGKFRLKTKSIKKWQESRISISNLK